MITTIAVFLVMAVAVAVAIGSDNAAKRKRKLHKSDAESVSELSKKL